MDKSEFLGELDARISKTRYEYQMCINMFGQKAADTAYLYELDFLTSAKSLVETGDNPNG